MTSAVHLHLPDPTLLPAAQARPPRPEPLRDDARLFEMPADLGPPPAETPVTPGPAGDAAPELPQLAGRTRPRQLPDHARDALERLRSSGARLQQAREAGVDLARAGFMSRLLGTGLYAVAVGVALALTVTTGGAAAPMLAIASARFLHVAADAGYALRIWRDARDAAAGKPVRPPPPMGANALGNLFHAVFSRAPFDPARAVDRATRAAAFVQFGLAVSALALGTAVPVPAALAHQVSRLTASTLLLGLFARETGLLEDQARQRDLLARATQAFEREREAILDWLASLEGNDRLEALAALVDDGQDPALDGLVREASLPANDRVPSPAAPERSPEADRMNARVRDTTRGGIGGYTVWNVINGSLSLARLLAR